MGPVGHTVISAGVAAGVWAATQSAGAAAWALGVGVLMDVDHVYDYYQWYVKRRTDKIYVLFHAWEYSIAGLAMALLLSHPLLLAAALGHLAHVATDQMHNHPSRFGYSIVYRVLTGFDAESISPGHTVGNSYVKLLRVIPFGQRLAPWFQSRIATPAGHPDLLEKNGDEPEREALDDGC